MTTKSIFFNTISNSIRRLLSNLDSLLPLCVYGRGRVVFVIMFWPVKVSKGSKIRNRYNQVPHLTQDTTGKVTNSQLDTTNESQEASPFPAGGNKVHINRRAQRHSKHKTEQKHKRSIKEEPPWNGQ